MADQATGIKLVHITTVPISLVALIGDQVAYMKQRGLDVYGLSSPGELAEKFTETQDAPFHAVAMTREITPFKDVVSLGRIYLKLRQLKPHIVHSHTPKAGLLGTLAAWLAGTPVRIYQVQGLRYLTTSGLKRRILMLSEKVACLAASQVICNSHSNMERMIADRLCSNNKIKVLHHGSGNGVDAEGHFNPAKLPSNTCEKVRSEQGIPNNVLVMGSIGRIVRDKGIIELAAAWQQLKTEYTNLHWLVVGPFETEDPVPADIRHLLETEERIHLTGYVDNRVMPELLCAIDVLAFPSYREGFPFSLLEAAAMGVPVVATNVPGCVDAVVDGITGTLVPVKDSVALANALRRYLDDSYLREAQGISGRDRVIRDFCPEDIWEAMYEMYVKLLVKHGVINSKSV